MVMRPRIGDAEPDRDQIVEPGFSGARHFPPGSDVEHDLVSARQQRVAHQQRGIAASVSVGVPRAQLRTESVTNSEQRQRESLGWMAKCGVERMHRQAAGSDVSCHWRAA